jgi:predicted nuclease of predicted toxin-antitoxin system
MKVRWLANENIPAPTVAVLRASGHDVLFIAESNPGIDDTTVLALAREEGRWLVTFDRDYGELLFARNYAPPPAVILLRVKSYRPDEPAAWLEQLLLNHESLLGKFTVFTGDTLRTRPLLHRV